MIYVNYKHVRAAGQRLVSFVLPVKAIEVSTTEEINTSLRPQQGCSLLCVGARTAGARTMGARTAGARATGARSRLQVERGAGSAPLEGPAEKMRWTSPTRTQAAMTTCLLLVTGCISQKVSRHALK